MSGLSELIAKLEGLSGPSSDVEKAILRHFGFTWRGMAYWNNAGEMWKGPTFFTHSIDAAVALVERKLPGAFYHVAKGRLTASEPLYGAQLLFGSEEVLGEGAHRVNLAIALCLALLRSLEGRDE